MPNYFTKETPTLKATHADDGSYHSLFNKLTGQFVRWGQSPEDDPVVGPPEICDWEISYGGDCIGCSYCYKKNGGPQETYNLPWENFLKTFSKLPKSVTQIAYGIMQINTHPQFWDILQHTRDNGVIPNYTTNGIGVTPEVAQKTKELCGAVAVSVHSKDIAYNAVKAFTDAGMTQVNIHQVVHTGNIQETMQILQDRLTDPRLAKMNAVVLLAYKPKGHNPDAFKTITDVNVYQDIIRFCRKHNLSFGCDSCSAPLVLKAYEGMDLEEYKRVNTMIEPCEAGCFSSYINADCQYFPCSFTEGEGDWEQGLDVLECEDFMVDIWNNPKTMVFRGELVGSRLIKSIKPCGGCLSQTICRVCPTFPGISCGGK